MRDGGLLSHLLPYGRLIANEKDREDMEKFWGLPAGRIQPKPGPTAVEMFRDFGAGKIKAMWIACTNPGQSLPNVDAYRKGMEGKEPSSSCPMRIIPTKTTELADLVLPAALWVEKDGTYGQSERRYQYVEKAVNPPAEARPDLDVMIEFANKLFKALDLEHEAKKLFAAQELRGRMERDPAVLERHGLRFHGHDPGADEKGARHPVALPHGRPSGHACAATRQSTATCW